MCQTWPDVLTSVFYFANSKKKKNYKKTTTRQTASNWASHVLMFKFSNVIRTACNCSPNSSNSGYSIYTIIDRKAQSHVPVDRSDGTTYKEIQGDIKLKDTIS